MNSAALVVYLESQGIEAARVIARTADASGYDYIVTDKDGRPFTENLTGGEVRLVLERMEWPKGVWPKVEQLIAGKGLKDIDE